VEGRLPFRPGQDLRGPSHNQPGNGAPSWIWVWNDKQGDHADYYVASNPFDMQKLYAAKGESATFYPRDNITKFRVCGPNGFGGDSCSDWHILALG
jgi:hypothetical protein